MATIVTVFVVLPGEHTQEHLEALAEFSITALRESTSEFLRELQVELEVRVEHGSAKIRARVAATAVAIGAFFNQYPDMRTGVLQCAEDARRAAAWTVEQIVQHEHPYQKPTIRIQLGIPGQIRSLFDQVERGGLTPSEATIKTARLIQNGEPELPNFSLLLLERFLFEFEEIDGVKDGDTVQQMRSTGAEANGSPDVNKTPGRDQWRLVRPSRGILLAEDPNGQRTRTRL